MNNILEKLRQFDAYPKTLEDVRIKTYGGATISIVSCVIMAGLFFAELANFMTPDVAEELFVDTSRSPKIQINVDIMLPSISCDFVTLDAMDSSGEEHLQIDHSIFKRRIDAAGNYIDDPVKEDITAKSKNETQAVGEKTECGSCYGAALDPKKCCNTCEEVREAYRERRWALDNIDNITQCKEEKFSERLKLAFSQGCQIYGHLIVNRVSGSFHVAPGKSFSVNHVHVHDVQPFSSSAFNTSHQIKHLSFGSNTHEEIHNPLKDVFGYAEEGATMFQYYIKIVPTSYVRKDGTILNTNQFSVTKHQKTISIMSGESGMPGVFFQYELSPLMVKYIEKERSFGHFATNVCAIIGGVYTVAGLLDTLIYHSIQIIKKKIELGKSN